MVAVEVQIIESGRNNDGREGGQLTDFFIMVASVEEKHIMMP
jgi:hypothetical protein